MVFGKNRNSPQERPIDDFDPADFGVAPKKASCRQRVCCAVVVGLLAIGTISSLSIVLTGDPNPAKYFIPLDPPGASEVIAWDTLGTGLDLIIEDATDETWTTLFTQSIAEWNESPGANLSTENYWGHNPECTPRYGRLKVCNSDYGNTNWKGINKMVLREGRVVHSVSKLNDYHLPASNTDARRYTMCHEVGTFHVAVVCS